ncbi:MAG: hypothetical protein IBX69_05555 [Anaerolineales bacterium]|nr:hypothetical protein [Anaerolineales bacterium]
MEKRYKALRFIGTLYKVLGVILLILTVLGAIGICGASIWGGVAFDTIGRDLGVNPDFANLFGNALDGLIVGFLMLLYFGFISLTTYAFGEGIYLLLAMEENTRASSLLLQRQMNADSELQKRSIEPGYPPPQPSEGKSDDPSE